MLVVFCIALCVLFVVGCGLSPQEKFTLERAIASNQAAVDQALDLIEEVKRQVSAGTLDPATGIKAIEDAMDAIATSRADTERLRQEMSGWGADDWMQALGIVLASIFGSSATTRLHRGPSHRGIENQIGG